MRDEFWEDMIIGIPLCRKQDYDTFRTIFEDASDLPDTWEKFTEIADASEQHFKQEGKRVFRVYIDPHTFPDWCARNGYRVNSHARRIYAYRQAQAYRGN